MGRFPQFLLSIIAVLAVSAGTGPIAAAQTPANVLYRDTFRFCEGATSQDAASKAKWVALRAGSTLGKPGFLKIFGPGTRPELEDFNSAPAGFTHGHAFWSRAVFGLWIITREFSFDVSLLNAIEFDQRLSGINLEGVPNSTRLALLINGTWYVSDQGFRQPSPGRWASSATTSLLFPKSLTYGTVDDELSVGPGIPGNSGERLPATGRVEGFGVFLAEVNGRIRLDNFTIYGPAGMPAQSPQSPAPGVCFVPTPPAGATPTATPTPDTDDDDGGGDFEQIVPNETPPPQLRTPTAQRTPSVQTTPTPAPVTFCPSGQQGAGKSYTFTRRATKILLAQSGAVSLSALQMRNQAVFSVLAGRRLPVGSLVNVRAGDFDPVSGIVSVFKNSAGQRARFVLRGDARTAMARYFSQVLGGSTSSEAPLFAAQVAGSQVLNKSEAVCLPEMRRLIRAEVRRLKLSSDVRVLGKKKR